mgnify:CR=1 FL=1
MPDDRYVMRLSVCHETYSIEEFDLQFKRNTDRDGLPEGEAYGGFVTCTLSGMPGDELLRWAAYSHSHEDGEIRIYLKEQPDQQCGICLALCGRTASVCNARLTVSPIPAASSFCLPQEH